MHCWETFIEFCEVGGPLVYCGLLVLFKGHCCCICTFYTTSLLNLSKEDEKDREINEYEVGQSE